MLLLLLGAGWMALRLYLNSSAVLTQVTQQLAALYGGPVDIESVAIGFTSTTMRGLQFFEPGRERAQPPWLTVRSVTADVTLWQLIRGDDIPTRADVTGATVLLRFDGNGKLLTRFPTHALSPDQKIPWERAPQITIDDAQIVTRKAGHGDLTAKKIKAQVTNETGRLVVTGAADSDVGKFSLNGSLDEKTNMATVSVATEKPAHVTQQLLDRLPMVPVAALQNSANTGDATGAVTVTYDLNTNEMHYRGELAAQNTKLYLPSLSVAIENGSGKLGIDDNLIRLRGAKGDALGGVVYAQGDLDFRGPLLRITVPELKAENLNVNEVPESWGIPAVVRKSIANGKLFGTGKLDVTIGAFGASPSPQRQIRLESQGTGEVRDPAGKREPIEFDWRLAPPAAQPGRDDMGWAEPSRRTDSASLLATLILLDAGVAVQEPKPKAAAL